MTHPDYQTISRHSLKLASTAIMQLSKRLPDEYDQAITTLLVCKRLIITTGVGKSGFIAQKMAATLTSTGSPAIFLDPLNALHGDLGIATKNDVVIAFSYSGESAELLALIPTLKQRQIPLISITGKSTSSLSEASTISLPAPIEREACPLNLAPTTSTSVALALADALAIGLMTAKKCTAEEFALNHPAGSLGRRLTLRVADLLPESNEPLTTDKSTLFANVICQISANRMGAICITHSDNTIMGIITDGDIRRTVEKFPANKLPSLQAHEMMTCSPSCINHDTLAIEALNMMEQRKNQISVLPVIDKSRQFLGILRLHDLIRAGL